MTQNYVIFTPEGVTTTPETVVIDTSFTGELIQDEDQRFYQTWNAIHELDKVWGALERAKPGEVQKALIEAAQGLADYITENAYATGEE